MLVPVEVSAVPLHLSEVVVDVVQSPVADSPTVVVVVVKLLVLLVSDM